MEINSYKKDFNKIVEYFEKSLGKIQTGKASPSTIEELQVFIPSYGQMQSIQSLGNVSIMDSQTIKIESWDKSVLPHIEKGIYDSGLGFTPVNQGDRIMIKIPPMTEERRKDIVKLVKKELEEVKIRVRNIRHDILKEIKNEFDNKEITEDEKKQYEKQLDELTKEYNKKLEEISNNKEKEVMKI